ncbi:hypothetical protein OPT61_g927 [Boeremia exigua]|uniref:Uncharacterized protein n=1 Tax=Boeremia exigua TaxID=749465 RepID=A0ACC2IS46_9PLEO|nr:hypothetical protein OPT61_g927 [Boeremia exigua]
MLGLSFTATRTQIASYLFGVALFSIAFLVFLNSSISFVITQRIGRSTNVGSAVGTLGFVDELVALVACPAWGLLSDKVGVRTVAVTGYVIVGVSLWVLVQAKNVYPQLLLARVLFSLGGSATATMVTAILPTMTVVKEVKPDPRSPTLRRVANGSRHAVAASISSELTITPDRFRSNSQEPGGGASIKKDTGASTSQLAGLVGMFTGCGALLALLVFLPLPTRFQEAGESPAAAVAAAFYVVGAIAILVAIGCFFGLRQLPGEDEKGWRRLTGKDEQKSTARARDLILSYPFLFLESIRLGFKSPLIGLGYVGGFVARASSVAISLFIPLFTNHYFLQTGECAVDPSNPSDIKHACPQAYKLAAMLTGISQLIALLCAPAFGYLSGKYPKHNAPLLLAAASGIAGYAMFGSLASPDYKSEDGTGAVFIIVALLGISQIGAIVCSLALLGRGINNDESSMNDSALDSSSASYHPSAGATPPTSEPITPVHEEEPLLPHTQSYSISRPSSPPGSTSYNDMKGTIAGTYSLLGGFGILLLTKAGGALFDSTGPGSPFYMMAAFNAVLLVVGVREPLIGPFHAPQQHRLSLPAPTGLLHDQTGCPFLWYDPPTWNRTAAAVGRDDSEPLALCQILQVEGYNVVHTNITTNMSFDTEVLIIGAGMSGLGLAVQIIRKYGVHNFELIEKSNDVGGTWLQNTYPGCGCDVASHFYSYSFALNPDWSRKYSMREEIQQYFRNVSDQYGVTERVRFHSVVEKAVWNELDKVWVVDVLDLETKERTTRRARVLVSGVGSLSVPKECDVEGKETFKGSIFHSATWDHSFDWSGKDVVVLGNGCSATQFVPIMTGEVGDKPSVRKLTQFARQAQYLSERENPYYSPTFKAVMRYVPLAMRLYRAKFYYDMEADWVGFPIESGAAVRSGLAKENEAYVKRTAPKKYWDALIPRIEIGCKRKVLDTEYLKCLWRDNIELIPDDPVRKITEGGVVTKSGREIHADAIVLANGFATQQMLCPMEIVGREGLKLNDYWDNKTQGVAQAYFGTVVPNFPNCFILMGPNTVTGHLSVIYTVECQINFTLRLLEPILKSLPSYQSRSFIPSIISGSVPTTIEVRPEAAMQDFEWTQREAKKLVWASGCTNWAIDPKTGMNNMMYPDWQFMFWFRSVFWRKQDFVFRDGKSQEVQPGRTKKWLLRLLTASAFLGAFLGKDWLRDELPRRLRDFDAKAAIRSLTTGRA